MEEEGCGIGRRFVRGFVILVKDIPPHINRVDYMGVVFILNLLKISSINKFFISNIPLLPRSV